MGQNFHKIEAVRLEGGDPPSPPKAVSLTAFSQFFFEPFPKHVDILCFSRIPACGERLSATLITFFLQGLEENRSAIIIMQIKFAM